MLRKTRMTAIQEMVRSIIDKWYCFCDSCTVPSVNRETIHHSVPLVWHRWLLFRASADKRNRPWIWCKTCIVKEHRHIYLSQKYIILKGSVCIVNLWKQVSVVALYNYCMEKFISYYIHMPKLNHTVFLQDYGWYKT